RLIALRLAGRARMSAEDERGDDGSAPDLRRGVAEEEAVMAVEDTDAEGGEDEQRDAGKEDPDEDDGEGARVSVETGSDQIEQPGRRGYPDQRQRAGQKRQQPGAGAGYLARFPFFAAPAQRRIDGDEAGGEHALTEQVLQEVRDAQRGRVGVRGGRRREVIAEHALADQPGDPAQEDPCRDEQRRGAFARGYLRGGRRIGRCGNFGHAAKDTGGFPLRARKRRRTPSRGRR